MRAFKHIDPEFADRFRFGESIQLGTLEYYRAAEGPRADAMEGLAENRIQTFDKESGQPIAESQQEVLRGMGMHLVGQGQVQLRNFSSYAPAPFAFIFCASGKPDPNLRAKGQRIFKIMSFNRFASLLVRASGGRLRAFQAQRVSYECQVSDAFSQGLIRGDPFKKNPSFAWEDEVRICFQADLSAGVWPERTIIIRCPEVIDIIKEV